MAVIFLVSAQSSLPQMPEPWLDVLLKKTGHAIAYGLLAWLYLRAVRRDREASDGLRLLSLLLAAAYGVSDEFHQSFVPGRVPRLSDVLVDGTGATLAMLLQRWWSRRPARRPR